MDVATLAQDAMMALGSHGDPRAREALARAEVVVEPDVRRWTASGGVVHGHRVRVRLDARTLGVIRAHPAAEDSLQTAFARAIAAAPDQSLADFAVEWSGAVATVVTTYRGEVLRAGEADLAEALAACLDGAGEREAAARVRPLAVRRASRDEVAVQGDVDELSLAALRVGARALLGERARVTSS